MKASITSPGVGDRARTLLRGLASVLLLFFTAAAIAGGGHGGGHGGSSHHGGGHVGGHGFVHHGHGFIGFGVGGWYPGPYYRDFCNPNSPYYDVPRCRRYYPDYDGAAPYLYGPSSGGVASPGPDGFAVSAPLLFSSDAPESLPDVTRVEVGIGQPAPEPASGS